MEPIAVSRSGQGPEVLLVHGGASAATTWDPLAQLAERWSLAIAHRRGYPPSPPDPEGHHDFDVDADDLEPLLETRPHVVAHSYGALGAVIAVARRPSMARSLTLIEPPIYQVAPEDSQVAHFKRIGDAVLSEGLDADPAELREFLAIAGAPVVDGPLPEAVANGVRRAQWARSPGEAHLPLSRLREAGLPVLIASGDHTVAIERICEALAAELAAERIIAPGAGHFVAAAPDFAEALERFWLAAAGPSPERAAT